MSRSSIGIAPRTKAGRSRCPKARAFLGVDGGGSKARAILEYGGRIVVRGDHQGLNPVDIGFKEFERRLRLLLAPLLGCLPDNRVPVYACFALAGAGKPSIRRRCRVIILRVLRERARCGHLDVTTDAHALLARFRGKREGIVLIAGTGSICLGMKRQRRRTTVTRVGGLGGGLDAGSGYRMGIQLLQHAWEVGAGREGPSDSIRLFCRRRGIAIAEISKRIVPPDGLIRAAVRRGPIADLAKVVLEAYDMGDRFSAMVVEESVSSHIDMIVAVKERAGLSSRVPVVASGGLLASQSMRRLLRKRLKRALPEASLSVVTEPLLDILGIAKASDRSSAR
ncbi:MAG: BadF/BadG/BcrA/BcrD ATPase family protein [Candidatus Eisenbacteria bacterium]